MHIGTAARWLSHRVRYRLGFRVAAEQLESGTDADITAYYGGRVTDCEFLTDPAHYEHPRAGWLLDRRWHGGTVLEVGCGNGGFTRLVSPLVDRVVALDISRVSLDQVRALGLPNVETVEALIERYSPTDRFDWIIMSEVLEHLRAPRDTIASVATLLKPGGTLLITTPHGHWDSDEHLQEFTMSSFAALIAQVRPERMCISFLRDREGQRRWLTAEVDAPRNAQSALSS